MVKGLWLRVASFGAREQSSEEVWLRELRELRKFGANIEARASLGGEFVVAMERGSWIADAEVVEEVDDGRALL